MYVHRPQSTVVENFNQPTNPRGIFNYGSHSIDAATHQQTTLKQTLQSFMREQKPSRFVAHEHIEIRQPNRQLRLTYAVSRQHWEIEDWMRMQWSGEW